MARPSCHNGSMKSLHAALNALVDLVTPGEIKLSKSRLLPGESLAYDLAVRTRAFNESYTGGTVRETVLDALWGLQNEVDIDPFVPAWHLLSRMQRELVLQTLREILARHLAAAAEANLAHSRDAEMAYLKADAFQAAIDQLAIPNGDDEEIGCERLQARTSATPERDVDVIPKQCGERLAAAVQDLKAKNRRRARGDGEG